MGLGELGAVGVERKLQAFMGLGWWTNQSLTWVMVSPDSRANASFSRALG